MTRIQSDQPLVPSVLDRLLDDDPDLLRERPRSRNQVLRELKQSVRRDLENLLNTRRRCVGWPPHLEELKDSLVNYGLPDIAGTRLGSNAAREEFRETLESVIRRLEPRFKTVRIELLQRTDETDRTLRFRIEGLLHAQPAPEPVAFDSALDSVTGSVEIKGAPR